MAPCKESECLKLTPELQTVADGDDNVCPRVRGGKQVQWTRLCRVLITGLETTIQLWGSQANIPLVGWLFCFRQ